MIAALVAFAAGAAEACPAPSDVLLFHSCWGASSAEVLLLPEQAGDLAAGGDSLAVTGAYTGKDQRGDGLPNPVGLFVHRGEVVNPTLARMDGILIVRDGQPSLHHRARVDFGGRRYDLTDPAARAAFSAEAAKAGASVLQSHLLVIDGEPDIRPVDDAPTYTRRLLFTDAFGFGVYETDGAVTLHEAATRIEAGLSPRMALNLDMGSYDYCVRRMASEVGLCGVLGAEDTAKLSNVIRLSRD